MLLVLHDQSVHLHYLGMAHLDAAHLGAMCAPQYRQDDYHHDLQGASSIGHLCRGPKPRGHWGIFN